MPEDDHYHQRGTDRLMADLENTPSIDAATQELVSLALADALSPTQAAAFSERMRHEPFLAALYEASLAELNEHFPPDKQQEEAEDLLAALREQIPELRAAPSESEVSAFRHSPRPNFKVQPLRRLSFTDSRLALAACLALLLGVGALWWKWPRAASPDVIKSAPLQSLVARFDVAAAKAMLSRAVINTATGFRIKGAGEDPVNNLTYTKDVVVVSRASGAKTERPYVVLPVRFQQDSDELADGASRENLAGAAQALKDLAEAGAIFSVEVHAGAGDGKGARGPDLAKRRAAKVRSLLVEQGVLLDAIARAEGFDFEPARFQEASGAGEALGEQNSRVLVVRIR